MEMIINKNKLERYSAYKDSGVEWLGEIPEHWHIVQSKRLFQQRRERARKEDEQLTASQKHGVILQKEFMRLEGRKVTQVEFNHEILKHVEKGDFVISMRSFQGGIEYCNYAGCVSSAYVGLIPIKHVIHDYFKYLFKSDTYIKALSSTSNLVRDGQALRFDNFSQVDLLIIPEEEQTRIANFLEDKCAKIDQAIQQKERLIELLQERKQIIIQNAVTCGLNPEVQMKDSGVDWIGEIPKHWKIVKLKQISNAFGRIGFRGYSTSDLVVKGEGAITISPSNIKGDEMIFKKCSYLSWEKYDESPEIQIFENDVLIVKTGSTFGKVGLVSGINDKATINPQLLVFKDIEIQNSFFYELLVSKIIQTQIKREVIGSTIPTISETKILNMKTVLPPNIEIEKIVQYIEGIKQKFNSIISINKEQIKKLKEYKQVLINEVVTGKVKV